MYSPRCSLAIALTILHVVSLAALTHGSGNRFSYLDEPLDPYYVHGDFPQLIAPQWTGDPNVDAVVVLAIDDMRDAQKYENYLRPVLDRLKRIDGRAPVSIMTNRIDPEHPLLGKWISEGLSIEVHTIDHPCPCLAGGSLSKSKSTYDRCVDLMGRIEGNNPVAFRMPCCDSQNTPSPRFWTEVFNKTTSAGNFLTIDSSVFQIFTSADKQLPRSLVLDDQGAERFRRYIPFPSFVNTIENYPYPYIIGRNCWQFPCMVPSDWEAQHVQQPNNPRTVQDLKRALDATVLKKGVFNLVFHPHGWIRNDQIVELIDHAIVKHAGRVKFLNFNEALKCLEKHLLAGHTLRDASGHDNGVRLLDLNDDGYLDVVIGNQTGRLTRVWQPDTMTWREIPLPTMLVENVPSTTRDLGVRFGVVECPEPRPIMLKSNEDGAAGWYFAGDSWKSDESLVDELSIDGRQVLFSQSGVDRGARLRDLDENGSCELVVSNAGQNAVFQWDGDLRTWKRMAWHLPPRTLIVDAQGRDAGLRFFDINADGLDDLLFSNEQRYSVHLFHSIETGWDKTVVDRPRDGENDIPMIANHGTNNGAWFHSNHLWVQNESTDRLADGVDRLAFATILQRGDAATSFPAGKTATASLADISTRPEMTVELVAAEPLVSDPVAFDWSPEGHLWVAEMRDYPMGDGDGKHNGRLKLLKDTDHDGRYDTATVFVDELPYPTAVKTWRLGVLVLAAPDLIYAEDTDGDGRADVRKKLFTGFRRGNPQHLANGLRWGLDNWLYLANGDSGGDVTAVKTDKKIAMGSRDLRIRVDEGHMETMSGQTQFGRNRDDWGNWFGGNNSRPVWHYVLEDNYMRRNPSFVPPDSRHEISVRPGAAPVYPTSRTVERFNDFEKANRFTSACSPMIYRDTLLGEDFYGNSFVCEPVHNLVQREIVKRDGVTFQSQRAGDEQTSEFLSSKDNWFRPTMVRTGPDGAIWVADMYRLVIEHPEWIPRSWQQKLNLRDGTTMGRIYRVYPKNVSPRQWAGMDKLSVAELIERLHSPNGWQRDMAHQMLLWKDSPHSVAFLERMVSQDKQPQTRLQALGVLDGLGKLNVNTLLVALSDEHPEIVRHAIRLAEPNLDEDSEIRAAVLGKLTHEAPMVQLQLALSLGYAHGDDASDALARIAANYYSNQYVAAAVFSSLRADNVERVFGQLMQRNKSMPELSDLMGQLARIAGGLGARSTINSILGDVLKSDNEDFERRVELVTALLRGVERRRDASFDDLVNQENRDFIEQLYVQARSIAADESASQSQRQTAIRLLARGSDATERDAQLVAKLLSPRSPPALRETAVEVLAGLRADNTPTLLLSDWDAHSPDIRSRILNELLGYKEWTKRLLQAMKSGTVSPAHIDARRRHLLLQHRDDSISQLASQLFSGSNSNRQTVLQDYGDVGALKGDLSNGKAVFAKRCAPCHRLEGVGHELGPILSALTNRSTQAMLAAILDPNQAVEDRYMEYIVALDDGRQLTGILARETANSIVLMGQDGKQSEILRDQIHELRGSGKSLMPEGLERDMTRQELADVIAYIASRRPEAKRFPGNQPRLAPVRDDRSIRLLAIHAQIYGPTLVFEPKYRNLGHWNSVDDHAIWTVEVPRQSTYRVVVDYACADAAAGDSFVIEAAGQSVGGRVDSTRTWDEYESKSVGRLKLPAGRVEVLMRSDGPVRSALIDLSSIRLYPVD